MRPPHALVRTLDAIPRKVPRAAAIVSRAACLLLASAVLPTSLTAQTQSEDLADGVRRVEVRIEGRRVNLLVLRFGAEWLAIDPLHPAGTRALLERGDLDAPLHTVVALGSSGGAALDGITVIHATDRVLDAPRAIAFERELRLTVAGKALVLRTLGAGASASDVAAWLPGPGIVFAGAVVQRDAVIATADTELVGWRHALDGLRALTPRVVVPFAGLATDASVLESLEDVLLGADAAVQDRLAGSTAPRPVPERAGPTLISMLERDALHGVRGSLGDLHGAQVAIPIDPDAPASLVLLTGILDPTMRGRLRKLAPNVTVLEARDAKAALEVAPRIQACDARFATQEFLAAAPRLVWVQAFSAGVENLLARPALRDRDAIVLTNMRATAGDPIADHAFGMLLQLTRGLREHHDAQRRGAWERDAAPHHDELAGRTLLVVGLGGIGRAVALRGRAFGMRVLATDVRINPKPESVDRIALPAALDELLPIADVIVVCVPLTAATRGMFSAERLARCKRGATLINVARGAIVDSEALVAALEAGRLGGAALDVVDPEPLPAGHPLWSRNDVVITPHVAGRSPRTDLRRDALFAENVRRFAHGEPLLNTVDKRAGY